MENDPTPRSGSPASEAQELRTSASDTEAQEGRSSSLTVVLFLVPLVLFFGGAYLLLTGLSRSVPQAIDGLSKEISEAMKERPPAPLPPSPKDTDAPPVPPPQTKDAAAPTQKPPTSPANADDESFEMQIAALTQAIEENVKSAEAWQRRADAWRVEKQWAEAISDYDKAIALAPLKAVLYNDRGLIFYELGDLERARNDYSWSIVLDERMDLAYFNRGLLHRDQGDNAAAEADFTAFLKLNPEDGEAWRRRGEARFQLGNETAAFEDFSKAIAFDPKDAYALAYRCGTAIGLSQLDAAEQDCKAALSIESELAEALNNLAWLYYKRGDYRAGLSLAERAVRSGPKQAANWDTRAHLLEALGERDKAIESFKKALELDDDLRESIDGLKRLGESP